MRSGLSALLAASTDVHEGERRQTCLPVPDLPDLRCNCGSLRDLVGPLPRGHWPVLAAFIVFGTLSQVCLFRSCKLSDFSLAYPVARGVVPLAMALLGVVWLGDQLTTEAIGGILAITLGILSLAICKGGMTRHGWAAASHRAGLLR